MVFKASTGPNLATLSIGAAVPDRFTGRVYSVYPRACNLRTDSGVLLVLLADGGQNAPQGIRLGLPAGENFESLGFLPGQPVRRDRDVLWVGGVDAQIDLRSVLRWDSDLQGMTIDIGRADVIDAVRNVWAVLRAHASRGGLVPLAGNGGLAPPSNAPDPAALLTRKAHAAILSLVRETGALNAPDAVRAAAPLIGLGPGLTPSGDDFLLGFIAGLICVSREDAARREFMEIFGGGVLSVGTRTNEVSRSYLQQAVRGRVSEPLLAVCAALARGDAEVARRDAEAASRVGHSSGADALLGLVVGLSAWGQ